MRGGLSLHLLIIALALTGCQNRKKNPNVVEEKYVHRYGVEVDAKDWSNRGKHGKVISTLKNGVTETRNYNAGVLDGETTYTFAHSDKIEKSESYLEGLLVKEVVYFHSGNPRTETDFLSPSRRSVTEWYEDGNPKSVEEFEGERLVRANYYRENKDIDSKVENGEGQRILRDNYGQQIAADEVVGGHLVLRTTFHANGTPKEMIPFNQGKVEGVKRTFHPGGEPNTIEEWWQDKQHGKTQVFENGEKVAEIPYVNGVKSGTEYRYRNGSRVVERHQWQNDELHGRQATLVGNNEQVEWYYQGKKVSRTQFERMTLPNHR